MKETIAAFNKFIFTGRTAKCPHGPSMDQEDEFINIQEAFANISSSESDTPGSVDQPIVGNDQDSILSRPVSIVLVLVLTLQCRGLSVLSLGSIFAMQLL